MSWWELAHHALPETDMVVSAVWDTVGSLGVPNMTLLAKLGLHQSTKEFRFFDTNLSDRIEYAFQALALDENRLPFSPTIWERRPENQKATDLRQVWFPGNHGNIGGGWQDAGVANMSLACESCPPNILACWIFPLIDWPQG